MFFLFAFLEFEVNCFIYCVEKIIKCLFVVMSVWELFVLFCFLGGFKNLYCNIFYLKCHESQPNSANAYLIDKTADVAQMITVCLSLATQHALQQSVKKKYPATSKSRKIRPWITHSPHKKWKWRRPHQRCTGDGNCSLARRWWTL